MSRGEAIVKFLKTNAPAILTGLSIAGTVSTAILAVKATPKALDELDEAYLKKGEALDKKEIIKATWRCYIPSAISGAATICCIVGANYTHIRKEAGLAAMAGFFEQRYFDYKDKVVEITDEETDRAIETALAKDKMEENKPLKTMRARVNDGEMLCYEPITEQYFITNQNELLWAKMTANNILSMEKTVTLNHILKLFPQAEHTHAIGNEVGWWLDDSYFEFVGYNWGYYGRPWMDIIPEIETVDGQEVYVIHFTINPTREEAWDKSFIEEYPDENAKKHMDDIVKEGKYISTSQK